jgi:outer membrane receptor protein involved in Fe transport
VNAGFFGQALLDFKDRYFFTAGLRVDGNSAFGDDFGLQVYPKASLSWVISDESFFPGDAQLKLRAAVGAAGRAPGAFDAVRTWRGFFPSNVGNADLGPERTTEFEAGFDAGFWDNRITSEFTYYHKTTDEALFYARQMPTLGFLDSQLANVGKIENKGIEAMIDARTSARSGKWAAYPASCWAMVAGSCRVNPYPSSDTRTVC